MAYVSEGSVHGHLLFLGLLYGKSIMVQGHCRDILHTWCKGVAETPCTGGVRAWRRGAWCKGVVETPCTPHSELEAETEIRTQG